MPAPSKDAGRSTLSGITPIVAVGFLAVSIFSWRVHGAGIYLKPKQAAGRGDPLFEVTVTDGVGLNPKWKKKVIERSS